MAGIIQKEIIDRARAAFNSGKTLPVDVRIQQLKNMIRMIEECEDEIVTSMRADLRKPKMEGTLYEIEVLRADLKGIIRDLRKWVKGDQLPMNVMSFEDKAEIRRDPYGLVLILGAWNYPFTLSLQPMAGAISAGNCVILKPSEIAPKSSATMAKLIPKYLDNECYHVIEADLEETKLLLTNQFDYIFATGSVGMGKAVLASAAPFLTPVTLELGGKSPCYIDETANLEIATRRILWGKWMNLGQTCIAPDYILCSKNVEKQFVDIASKVLVEWYGQNWRHSPDLARIINERNFLRLKGVLDRSKARVAFGGDTNLEDRWISPTILVDVSVEDSVMEDELFGPILPILTVNSHQEAIKFITSRPKPLALYIFSKNNGNIEDILKRTSSGSICVNDTVWQAGFEGLPFGGVGNSGMGNYHGRYSYETFSHKKAVLQRGFNGLAEWVTSARYPPYTDKKMSFFRTVIRNLHHFNVTGGWIVTHGVAIASGVALVFLLQFLELY